VTRPNIWAAARFAALTAAVVVAGHDLVYIAAHGLGSYRSALDASGHGVPWTGVGAAALLAAAALGAITVQRSRRLNRRLRDLGGADVGWGFASGLARRIGRLWLLLLATGLAVFTVQENIEHFAAHGGHFSYLEVLYAGEHALAIPVFALLSLAAATVGGLALERLHVLAKAVANAENRSPRPERVGQRRPSPRLGRPRLLRGQPDLGRAPPQLGIVTP
jgi:hypothetical protein